MSQIILFYKPGLFLCVDVTTVGVFIKPLDCLHADAIGLIDSKISPVCVDAYTCNRKLRH